MLKRKSKGVHIAISILIVLNSVIGIRQKSWKKLNKGLDAINHMGESYLMKKAKKERIKEVSAPVFKIQNKLKSWLKGVKTDNKDMIKRIKAGKPALKAKEPIKFIGNAMKAKPLNLLGDSHKKNKVEKIIIPRVVINERKQKPGKPLRKILINKLIVLNSDNDDPDGKTIFIEKAVIDPSVYRDKTIDNFFKMKFSGFKNQIEDITKKLSKIKFSDDKKDENTKKEHMKARKQLQSIKTALKNIKFPKIDKKFRLRAEENEIKKFEQKLENEINTVENINKDKKVEEELEEFSKVLALVKKEAQKTKEKSKLNLIEEGVKKLLLKEKGLRERLLKHKIRMEELLKKHRKFVVQGEKAHSEALKKLEAEVRGD